MRLKGFENFKSYCEDLNEWTFGEDEPDRECFEDPYFKESYQFYVTAIWKRISRWSLERVRACLHMCGHYVEVSFLFYRGDLYTSPRRRKPPRYLLSGRSSIHPFP